jgi:RNA polymerase sigma-70 factor (ECF subfamily)
LSATSDALAMSFLAERSTPSLPAVSLGSDLEAGYLSGRERWPEIDLSIEQYARHLAGVLPEGIDLEGALVALNLPDLYLAAACAQGCAGATEIFEARLLRQVGAFVARIGTERDFVEEIGQRLRIKLLVGSDGEQPRIGQYGGRGSLESWVCAAAIRLAIDLRRSAAPASDLDSHELAVADSADPELEYLKHEYAGEFRNAAAEAFGALSPRERTLLRLYYLERLTLDKIAPIYRVHATTVMRWLGEARDAILAESRRLLRERLRLSESEIVALLPMMRSNLDLSVRRLVESKR